MKLGIAAGILAGIFWGTVFLGPALLHDFSPVLISLARYLLYGAVSFLLLLPNMRAMLSKLNKARVLILIKLVFTGNIIYYILVSVAIQLIGVAPVALIVGLVPFTSVLFGQSKDSVPIKRLIGPMLIIAIGIICINTDVFSHIAGVSLFNKITGLACAVLALAMWSWYAFDNSRYLKSMPDVDGGEWSILYGLFTGILSLALLALAVILPVDIIPQGLDPSRWHVFFGVCLFLAVFASTLGNINWFIASKRLPISLLGQMIVFETVFALIYGFLYAWRLPRLFESLAVILLIGGVLWAVRQHRQH